MADETKPVDFLPNLPPRTELEQLTAAFEAGLLTPALFALAKEKLLHPSEPEALPPPSRSPALPVVEENAATAGELPSLMSFFKDPVPVAPTPTPAAPPVLPRVEPAPALSQPAPVPIQPATTLSQPAPVEKSSYLFGKEIEATPVVAASHPLVGAPPATSQPPASTDFLGTTSPSLPPVGPPARPAAVPQAAPSTSSNPLAKVLLALGILGLLLLVYWQVAGSHPDEHLTSPHQPAASEASAAPVATQAPSHNKRTTKATRSKKHKGKKNKPALTATDSVATSAEPASAASATTPAAAPTEATPQPVPPASETGDTEAISEIRATIAGYYADMLAPPFTAAQHFAPHVQRLYIQQNLTPADIDASFTRNFFPDNKQAVLQIEPGTLRVSAPAADGTRMATFVEASRVYHPSRQGYQRLRAQVRARFDADYKIVYLRQERLLESTLE